MNRAAVSIALCTYNGEKYLPEQLNSFTRQDILPDELVVCDDGSTDATPTQLASFAANAPFPVRIVRNPSNLGSNANFAQAITRCTGEIIFLSDQDDVWKPGKISRTLQEFTSYPALDAVFTDGEVIDSQSRTVDRTLWHAVRFDTRAQRRAAREGFHRFLHESFCVTGATLAFRQRLRQRILPLPMHLPFTFHDAWIARVASVGGGIASLPERLICYREHPAQQIGFHGSAAGAKSMPHVPRARQESLRDLQHQSEDLYQELRARSGGNPALLAAYRQAAEHHRFRVERAASLPRRAWQVAGELLRGGYREPLFTTLKRALGDALLPPSHGERR